MKGTIYYRITLDTDTNKHRVESSITDPNTPIGHSWSTTVKEAVGVVGIGDAITEDIDYITEHELGLLEEHS